MHRSEEAERLDKEWDVLMEFELDRTQMNGFETLLDVSLRQEETLEMIVPDACPDILRVVETDGTALLTGRQALDGRVELSGTMKLQILYLPEGENWIRHLEMAIPFTCFAEAEGIGPACAVVATARLCHADTRAINPRKVLARAEAAVDVTVFAPRSWTVCGQVEDGEGERVEQLSETREVYLTACVQEKPCPVSEEVPLSAGKPAAAELLKSRVELIRGDFKIIGNKLIFKGSANVFLLYRGEDNGVYSTGAELPFSQIMEMYGAGEEADCEVTLALTGAELALSPAGEGRAVSVELEVVTQAVVRELRSVQVLIDAYSTSQPLVCDRDRCQVDGRTDRGVRTQNVREVWETPVELREITECHVAVGQVIQSREGEKLILSAQAEVQVLAVSEEGGPVSFQHAMVVPCPLELPEGCRCFARCEGVGDVYATPASGGIEVRFTLDFRYDALVRREIVSLCALRTGEPTEEEGDRPSLVLRMFEGGERLWDVAKAYGTTIADIISANELEDESAAAGKLLLIPRRR